MYNSNKVAENIKIQAKKKNVSIKLLLEECGIGRNAMSHMTNGSMPKGDTLGKIADYLECSVDYLLGRTDDPTWNKPIEITADNDKKTPIIIKELKKPKPAKITLPLYPQSASAGTGNYLFDADPIDINIEKNNKTADADFLVRVSGDSMLPKFHDGDIVLVKQSPLILEGDIGIFGIDGDSFIKQLGKKELISLNPNYPNIPIKEFDSVHCFGQVIGILDI